MSNGKQEGGIQIGTSSLVLIFVVLALTVFAVLSITSSLADDRLTDRTESWVTSYYAADATAEERLASLDGIAKTAAMNNVELATAIQQNFDGEYDPESEIASFAIEINDTMNLEVEIQLTAQRQPNGKYYKILKWQEVKSGEYVIDDSMLVWNGDLSLEMED